MSFQVYSIQTPIGGIDFYPVGFTWSNREAAIMLARNAFFQQECNKPKSLDESDYEDFFEKEAQSIIDSAVKSLKKEKKSVFVSMFFSTFSAFYDESLGEPDSFKNGIIPFIVSGDTRKFLCDSRFSEYARLLRRENGIGIDFGKKCRT